MWVLGLKGLKQATKKKNERFITRRFRPLMTRLSIFLHLCDCNIIHISLDKGVMRPEMPCYKSFIFLSKLIQPTQYGHFIWPPQCPYQQGLYMTLKIKGSS